MFQKKVDVLISMETSAARNAGLPIVSKGRTPFIYTSSYEGHSCNKYMYSDAWVPEQQEAPVIDFFLKDKAAKTFFLIGSDYAFGRGMLAFAKQYIEAHGGKVIGDEYQPMDAGDWTAIISKVRAANPDALILSTAGGVPNVTLTKQYKAAGITALVGNLGVDEGTAKTMGADATGIYISGSYYTSVDSPANKTFLAAMRAKFGKDLLTPNDLSVPQYEAIYLYKAAVEKAKGTAADGVVKALAEVSFDGPRGHIQMNAQRHAPLTMYLGQVDAGRVEDVLQAVGDAVQLAARPVCPDRRLGSLGGGPGTIGGDGDEAVELAVERLDARQVCLGQLDRRELAGGDQPRRFGDGQEMRRVRHRSALLRHELERREDVRRLVAARPVLGQPCHHRPHAAVGVDQLLLIGRRQVEPGMAGQQQDLVARG
ncbi:MAG: hypothetical protein NVS2B11_12740 [Acetobacteraceae bacterium]